MPAKDSDREASAGSELGPLPGGHHGLSPEQVAESQRERLLAAIVEVVARRGYRGTTITEIVKTASVSTRVFYANFASIEAGFLATFEAILAHLEERLAAAAGDHPDWPEQAVAVLRAGLEFFAAEPRLARFCLVEPITATAAIATRLREAVLAAVPFLREGRAQRPADAEPLPDSTEDSLLGGLLTLASRAVLAGEAERLPALLPDLVEFALAPYLGPEAARRLAGQAA